MKGTYVLAAALLAGTSTLAGAATPTVAELLDVESTLTLKKMQQDVAKESAAAGASGAGSLAGIAPPVPNAAAKAAAEPTPRRERAPEGLVARFGVGSDLGGYLAWEGNTYAVRPGAKVKGYTVVSVNDDGVDLRSAKGKVRHFGSLIDSMAARAEQEAVATPVSATGTPGGGLGPIPTIPALPGAH